MNSPYSAPKTLQEAQERARLERSKAFYDLVAQARRWFARKPSAQGARPITL
ncbi:MAG: hypothetical protein AAFR93_08870 [Pseudomonadota bacterium]